MRAGILVLGPLLARFKKAKVSSPGGCSIGVRPIDIHLKALSKMGVKYKIHQGYVIAVAPKGLIGSKIRFPKISVGATENLIIAASQAKGTTILSNCAIEPEIKDLVNFLISMGCSIKWIAKRKLKIDGIEETKETTYSVMFDRIEAGTYLIAAAITEGNLKIKKIIPKIKAIKKYCFEPSFNSDSFMFNIIRTNKKLHWIYFVPKLKGVIKQKNPDNRVFLFKID